jgi:hypothetical protein
MTLPSPPSIRSLPSRRLAPAAPPQQTLPPDICSNSTRAKATLPAERRASAPGTRFGRSPPSERASICRGNAARSFDFPILPRSQRRSKDGSPCYPRSRCHAVYRGCRRPSGRRDGIPASISTVMSRDRRDDGGVLCRDSLVFWRSESDSNRRCGSAYSHQDHRSYAGFLAQSGPPEIATCKTACSPGADLGLRVSSLGSRSKKRRGIHERCYNPTGRGFGLVFRGHQALRRARR